MFVYMVLPGFSRVFLTPKLHVVIKKFGLTYEAAMTRLFRGGRTDTIRSLSNDSRAFVESMADPKATDEERFELLKVATAKHSKDSKDATTGKGIDRHLFGLYVVSMGKEIESDFLAGALGKPWSLSTSQQPYQQCPSLWSIKEGNIVCPGGGFGPVADDGTRLLLFVKPSI